MHILFLFGAEPNQVKLWQSFFSEALLLLVIGRNRFSQASCKLLPKSSHQSY